MVSFVAVAGSIGTFGGMSTRICVYMEVSAGRGPDRPDESSQRFVAVLLLRPRLSEIVLLTPEGGALASWVGHASGWCADLQTVGYNATR
jgi:hypothetical protein